AEENRRVRRASPDAVCRCWISRRLLESGRRDHLFPTEKRDLARTRRGRWRITDHGSHSLGAEFAIVFARRTPLLIQHRHFWRRGGGDHVCCNARWEGAKAPGWWRQQRRVCSSLQYRRERPFVVRTRGYIDGPAFR